MTHAAELRALVVTLDPWLVTTFTESSKEFGIDAQRSGSCCGVPDELLQEKYEALLLDFDTVPDPSPILESARGSPSNKKAVVFAVATTAQHRKHALDQGANFIFQRPLATQEIRRVLYAAYGLMTRERRRYFRCTAELPVRLRRSTGEEVGCKTLNISSNGLAISSPMPLDLAEKIQISLALREDGPPLLARGTVVWDDKHGKSGVNFTCETQQMHKELDTWLDAHFMGLLPAPRTKS